MISEAFWLRELRGIQIPLNDIISFSEVITSQKFGPVNPKYREYSQHIHESVRQITDLLLWGIDKIKSGEIELKDIGLLCHEELPTPLNAVTGFAEITMKEIFGPVDSRYRSYAKDIHASGVLINNIIYDLADLARLEAGQAELEEESVDVEKAVQEALREAVPQATQSQVTLTWVPSAAKLPNLYCDRRNLRQMLLTMLSSAAKFDPPGRMVEVGTDLSDRLAIVISDAGWGVLMDTLRLILTKSLIERHGGNLSIVSTPTDGVTVRLLFPPERIISSGG